MFYKHQSPEDRLAVWRAIRHKEHSSIEEVLSEFSSIVPIPRYIDYYTPKNWPNVFEIVREGYFCQSGITLIIAATLVNKKFITDDVLQFDVISNHINGNDGLVLVNNGYAYNFLPGKQITVEDAKNDSTKFGSHQVPVDQLFR